MDTYLAAAYWSSRRETVEDCARKSVTFLRELSKVSDKFSGWRERASSRKKALSQVPIDAVLDEATIASKLEAGRNFRDFPTREVIPELGFSLGLWNGLSSTGEEISLRIHCGDYRETESYQNVVSLSSAISTDVDSSQKIMRLSQAFVFSWEPEFFMVAGTKALGEIAKRAREKGKRWEPFLDVALYLNDDMLPNFQPSEFSKDVEIANGRLFLGVQC